MTSVLGFDPDSQRGKIEGQTPRRYVLVDRSDVACRKMTGGTRSTKAAANPLLCGSRQLMVQPLEFGETSSKLFVFDSQGLVLLYQHVVLRHDRLVPARQSASGS